MTLTIGAQALGSAWRKMILRGRDALEARHLDIGAGEQVDDGGTRHAHHVRDDDEGEGERRQGNRARRSKNGVSGGHVGKRVEDRQLDRQEQHQDIGDEELRRTRSRSA